MIKGMTEKEAGDFIERVSATAIAAGAVEVSAEPLALAGL